MSDVLTLAFAAGIVAAFNPCGFAMLPAYLGYFLGLEDRSDAGGDTASAVPRALAVSATMTAAFVAVFGIMGLIITQASSAVQDQLKWITLAIGIGLMILAVVMLSGKQILIKAPKMQKGTSSRSLGSMALFGVSYATASLTCTIGPFLAVTSVTFRNEGLVSGVSTFVAYGLGMGLLISALTVTVALARSSLVRTFRRATRHVNTISGVLMLVAGAYVTWYGWFEVRQSRDAGTRDSITDFGFDLSARLQSWVTDFGPGRLGLILALAIAALAGLMLLRRRRGDQGQPTTEVGSDRDAEPVEPVSTS